MDIREQEAGRKRDRARLLLRVYEETGGNKHAVCKVFSAAKAIGLEGDEAQTALQNLVDAGSLKRLRSSTLGLTVVQITPEGVVQAEANAEFPPKNLEETRAARGRFLEEVYRRTDGNLQKEARTLDVGQALGFEDAATRILTSYLEYSGLIKTYGIQELGVSLTENGLTFLRNGPDSLPPGWVIHVTFNVVLANEINNSIIQQGGDGAQLTVIKSPPDDES